MPIAQNCTESYLNPWSSDTAHWAAADYPGQVGDVRSDIVTVSHDAPGHNNTDAVKGTSHVIDGPGEFEIGGVFITGVQSDTTSSGKKKSKDTPRNTIYVF